MVVAFAKEIAQDTFLWYSSNDTGQRNFSTNIFSNTNAWALTCNSNFTSQASHQASHRVSWMPPAPVRGSLSVIQWNLFVILCIWTSIRPRVLKPTRFWYTHKYYQMAKHTLWWEGAVFEVIHEYCAARRLVKETKAATNEEMTMVQAYYLGMLGVRYSTGESSTRVLWPQQYAFLLNQGLVAWSDRAAWGLKTASINDRSDSAGMTQVFTLGGILASLWKVGERLVRGMTVAPLEIVANVFAICALAKYLFWWFKPKDIQTYALVALPGMSREDREMFDSLAMEDTYDVDDPKADWSRRDAFGLVGLAQKIGPAAKKSDPVNQPFSNSTAGGINPDLPARSERNIHESPSTRPPFVITRWDDELYGSFKWRGLTCLLMVLFPALHLIAWKYDFSTPIERLMWQTCAILSTISALASAQFRKVEVRWTGLMTIVRVGSVFVLIVCRIVLIALAFAALRSSPSEVFHVLSLWDK